MQIYFEICAGYMHSIYKVSYTEIGLLIKRIKSVKF